MKLVLLPGLNGTDDLFAEFIACLPKRFRVQVVTYPADESRDYSDLLALVHSQLPDDEEFVLVGESFSGVIAYRVAVAAPKNLRAVIFVAGFLRNPRPVLLGLARLLPLNAILGLPLPDWVARTFCLGGDADTASIRLLRATLEKVGAAVLAARLRQVAALHCKKRLSGVKAIYLKASADRLVPHGETHYRNQVENLRLVEVEGPHFLLQARPRECAALLGELL